MEPGNSKDTPTLYIENLQQQIHFMELELKILKEKIIEDEKSSGIGGLFDDEKTSHEHISQLKTKYSAMRIDQEHKQADLGKRKLEAMGEKFMLDAQQKTNKDNIKDCKKEDTNTMDKHNMDKFENERECKQAQQARQQLDDEVRSL